MNIEHTFTVHAPIQALWDFLLDIPQMSTCIPGAENVQALDDQTYSGGLNVKVGPITAKFQGTARLVEVQAPTRLVARGEARDAGSASPASATFTAELRRLADDATEVAYQVDASVGGTLGKFGQGVMREVARRMTGDFAQCVEARLQTQPTSEPAAPIAPVPRPHPSPLPLPAPAHGLRWPTEKGRERWGNGPAPSPLPGGEGPGVRAPVTISIDVYPDRLARYGTVGLVMFALGYLLGRRVGR